MALRKKVRLPELVIDTTASREDLEAQRSVLNDERSDMRDAKHKAERIITTWAAAEAEIVALGSDSTLDYYVKDEAVRIAKESDEACQNLRKRDYEIGTLLLQNEIESMCVDLRKRIQRQEDGTW